MAPQGSELWTSPRCGGAGQVGNMAAMAVQNRPGLRGSVAGLHRDHRPTSPQLFPIVLCFFLGQAKGDEGSKVTANGGAAGGPQRNACQNTPREHRTEARNQAHNQGAGQSTDRAARNGTCNCSLAGVILHYFGWRGPFGYAAAGRNHANLVMAKARVHELKKGTLRVSAVVEDGNYRRWFGRGHDSPPFVTVVVQIAFPMLLFHVEVQE